MAATTRRRPSAPPPRRAGDIIAALVAVGAVISIAAVFAWALRPAAPVQAPAAGLQPSPDFTQQPLRAVPPVHFPGFDLIGYSVAQPEPAALVVTVVWQTVEAPASAQTAVVQVEGLAGPAEDAAALPGQPWGAGPYTTTRHAFTVPAETPGQYPLWVSVRGPDGAALAGQDEAGGTVERSLLGTVDWPPAPWPSPTPFPPPTGYATPTPCQIGCPETAASGYPAPIATLNLTAYPPPAETVNAGTVPYPPPAETPLPWPTYTPCPGACPETPSPEAPPATAPPATVPPTPTPLPTYTPCAAGCLDLSATPAPP